MDEIDLSEMFDELKAEILLEAQVTGDSAHGCFFRIFGRLASENGDCPDLTYTPVPPKREGRSLYQVDGFSLDHERGELFIVVCDSRQGSRLEQLHAAEADALFSRGRRFIELALSAEFINSLEETSPVFQAAYPIYERKGKITRIRLMVFSNARLAARRPPRGDSDLDGIPVVLSVLDFVRYASIERSRTGSESIEVDLKELYGSPLPCLPAHGTTARYQAYLIAMPGELLAQIYGLYGAKLLEQNVRTFLQARTKVNAGIIKTVLETPEMFFAYNNGITATATGLRTEPLPGGALGLAAIDNLQIVNGGQTTASILYARDQQKTKADLSRVYVQMKLSVVEPQSVEEIVPKISRYANTQNRITEADFASSDALQITIQRISRRLTAPPRKGFLAGSKWFYERSRGQYKDAQAYMTAGERARFEAEFPKTQMIDKTDLAKFEMTWQCQPNIVSQGAQKCFLEFSDLVAVAWQKFPLQFNDDYYRRATAKALVFRWLDHSVATSEWYQNDRGYKAQIVTYSIAWLMSSIRKSSARTVDLSVIWSRQEVPAEVQRALKEVVPQVAATLKDAPAHLKNVGEYCKQEECWTAVSGKAYRISAIPDHLLVSIQEDLDLAGAPAGHRADVEMGAAAEFGELAPRASEIKRAAASKGWLSPRSESAIRKLGRRNFNLSSSERNALRYLLGRLRADGFE